MAWFFGKKRKQKEESAKESMNEQKSLEQSGETDAQETNVQKSAPAQQGTFPPAISDTYVGRGESYGPWDIDDENVPDYDDFLSMGSYYLPFMRGIELRVKANRQTNQILGTTITFGSSSLEIEAFAAPKTLGIWQDIREDLLRVNEKASEKEGVFGTEVMLPVVLKGGRTVTTRVVGVDGPRWMLRGIFSGPAASGEGAEADALNQFFANIVVERGDEPLAPRDLIPMHPPVTPNQRKAALAAAQQEQDGVDTNLEPPTGPFDSDQQVEVKTTLSRGPMFSEVR